eukprot:gene17537-24584_t
MATWHAYAGTAPPHAPGRPPPALVRAADQAAEHAVRLALALRKPFAVVPCCVYAAEFPQRRLPTGARPATPACNAPAPPPRRCARGGRMSPARAAGEPVRSHPELLDYLQSLHPGIRRG